MHICCLLLAVVVSGSVRRGPRLCLCLRSPNYVVICAIFGNSCDDDEANDKFAALSCRRCRLPVASCKMPVACCLLPSVELSVRSMSIGLLMAANASAYDVFGRLEGADGSGIDALKVL